MSGAQGARVPTSAPPRREHGQATIEMVALTAALMGVVVLVLQLVVFVYTAHGAAQAAREGARAYSLGQDADAAARAAAPGGVEVIEVDEGGPDHRVRVVVQAPTGFIVGDGRVERTVVMP